MDFGAWDHNFPEMAQVVAQLYRVLRKGGTAIIFYDLWKISLLAKYLEDAKFKQLRFIEWLKTNPVPINSKINYLTNSREIAISAVKSGKPTFHSKYDNGIYSAPICHEKGRFHPTQKPLALISKLIEKHSNPGEVVLDCFSGSGTTAVAAGLAGRSFLGCELDGDYFRQSGLRLQEKLNATCELDFAGDSGG
jgi:DNA modification methylase